MIAHDFKGGIGTSSRVLSEADGGWVVGALVALRWRSRWRSVAGGVLQVRGGGLGWGVGGRGYGGGGAGVWGGGGSMGEARGGGGGGSYKEHFNNFCIKDGELHQEVGMLCDDAREASEKT